jgi:hypothetical protein
MSPAGVSHGLFDRRFEFADDVEAMRRVFALSGDPGLRAA